MAVTPFDPLYPKNHEQTSLLYDSLDQSYGRSKFYIADVLILDLFCSLTVNRWPLYMN